VTGALEDEIAWKVAGQAKAATPVRNKIKIIVFILNSIIMIIYPEKKE
jgi:hypothetical protein